jgi:hypothetical protein
MLVAFQKAEKSHTTKPSPWSIFDIHNPQFWQHLVEWTSLNIWVGTISCTYCLPWLFLLTHKRLPRLLFSPKSEFLSIHMKHLRLIIIFLITLCFGPILFITGLKFFHHMADYLFGFMGPNWSVHMVNVTGAFLFCLVFCVCFGLIGVFISKCKS